VRVNVVVPLSLFSAWSRGDASDASTLHKCYTRELWRERSWPARVGVLAVLLVWWPVSNLAMLAWCTAFNGPATRRRTGKAVWLQIVEQIQLAVRHSIASPWYYIFDLWDDEKRNQAALYLNRYETKSGIYVFLKTYLGGVKKQLGDKLKFHEICLKNGLPIPSLLMALDRGSITEGERHLPQADVFVKPRCGCGGRGAEYWEYRGDGHYRSNGGQECTQAELLARLIRRSRRQPILVQRRLVNHPHLANLSTGALLTARMMTVQNERGEFEFTHAVLRTAVKRNSPVDNFHAGGIAAPVDARSGELGPALGGGLRGVPKFSDLGPSECHPLTGARISGRQLPFWREAVEIVTQAHRAFPGAPIIGWDVAFTPDGPVIVEGNSAPDLDIIQRCHQMPLGETQLAASLVSLVHRALAAEPQHVVNVPAQEPWVRPSGAA